MKEVEKSHLGLLFFVSLPLIWAVYAVQVGIRKIMKGVPASQVGSMLLVVALPIAILLFIGLIVALVRYTKDRSVRDMLVSLGAGALFSGVLIGALAAWGDAATDRS